MATYVELNLFQSNDESVALTLTDHDSGLPLNLAGASAIEMFIKASKTVDDTDVAVTKLTLLAGAITVTNAAAGQCRAAVPASALATAGTRWWRIDVVIGGKRSTAMYGPLRVTDT